MNFISTLGIGHINKGYRYLLLQRRKARKIKRIYSRRGAEHAEKNDILIEKKQVLPLRALRLCEKTGC